MKYERIASEKNLAKFEIAIDEKEWQETLDLVAEKSKKEFKVQGFRQGKAPRKIIEQNYGKDVFYDDAINEIANKYYAEILQKETEVEPISDPNMYLISIDDKGLKFGITVELKPEIVLGKYKGLTIDVQQVEVTDEEVNKTLDSMRERYVRNVEVTDRDTAEMKDIACIDFEGSVDNVVFEGGTAKDFDLERGSPMFIAQLEEQVVGTKVGESKDIQVKFPDDYPAENLKGKVAVFKIKLNSLKKKELPELNDEFASNASEFDTLKEYKDSIKKELVETKSKNRDVEIENKLVKTIVDDSKIELTDSIIDNQVDIMYHDYEHQLSHQNIKMEDYLKYVGKTEEELKTDLRKNAESRLKTSFVLQEIVKLEKISVVKQDIDEKIIALATEQGKTKEEFEKTLHQHDLDSIVNSVVVEKLLKVLKENNNIK